MVRLATKYSSSPCRLINVFIKETAAINICSNPPTCSVAICGKINPHIPHTFSDDWVNSWSASSGSILPVQSRDLGGGYSHPDVLHTTEFAHVLVCEGLVPHPKCLTLRSRAKCLAEAPLNKTLHPVQPHSHSAKLKPRQPRLQVQL